MNKFTKGNCETCTNSVDVNLTELHGMMMCDSCVSAEKSATKRAVDANTMIQESRSIDGAIQIKVDVFRAGTTAAIELMGSIQNDENIPESDKDYVMASESLRRYKHMQEVIFEKKKEFAEMIAAKETEMRQWQVQVHTFAGKVRDARREKFKNFDIQYQPKPVKSVKSGPTSSGKKKVTQEELIDAAKKYNVPMAAVKMISIQRNMTADQAAHSLADSMGRK